MPTSGSQRMPPVVRSMRSEAFRAPRSTARSAWSRSMIARDPRLDRRERRRPGSKDPHDPAVAALRVGEQGGEAGLVLGHGLAQRRQRVLVAGRSALDELAEVGVAGEVGQDGRHEVGRGDRVDRVEERGHGPQLRPLDGDRGHVDGHGLGERPRPRRLPARPPSWRAPRSATSRSASGRSSGESSSLARLNRKS